MTSSRASAVFWERWRWNPSGEPQMPAVERKGCAGGPWRGGAEGKNGLGCVEVHRLAGRQDAVTAPPRLLSVQ